MKALRFRDWVTVLIVPLVVLAALVGPATVIARVNRVQLEVTCNTIKANVDQIEALNRISRQLGLPRRYPEPEVPDECAGR